MSRLIKLICILSIFLSLALFSSIHFAFSHKESGINDLSNTETTILEKHIDKYMSKGKLPGLSITVVKNDKTVYQKGFGYANQKNDKTVDENTLFELGSNSKAFTALGILKLQNEGEINLNDLVTKYLPWLKVKYKGKDAQLTIEQLLYHTSGIPFRSIDKIPISNKEDSLEETVRTLINTELDSEPGKIYQYATINYDVLGLIISEVTKESYESYMEENIFKPLGLSNTYLYRYKGIRDKIAKGYKIGFLKPRLFAAPMYRGNKPAGYILSNGVDMAKWLKIQLGTSNDLDYIKSIITQSHDANYKVAPVDNSYYAGGWFVSQNADGEIYHSGSNPNYSSFIALNPQDKIGVAVLCNMNSDYVGIIGQGIYEIIQGRNYNISVNDFNGILDKAAIALIIINVMIILGMMVLLRKKINEIREKKRVRKKLQKKQGIMLGILFVVVSFVSYFIYQLPSITYNGVSFGFAFVWLPISIKVALYLLYLVIWGIYGYVVFISIFKSDKLKSNISNDTK